MVRLLGKARLDTGAVHDWHYLAMSLPDHPCHIRLRVRSSDPQEPAGESCPAFRHQYRRQPHLHAYSIWATKPSTRYGRHPDRVGHNHLDDVGYLDALPMDRYRPNPIFRLGVASDCLATVDHVWELWPMILRISQKLNTKIKVGKLSDLPLDENPYADWSSHIFTGGRTQSFSRTRHHCIRASCTDEESPTKVLSSLDRWKRFETSPQMMGNNSSTESISHHRVNR